MLSSFVSYIVLYKYTALLLMVFIGSIGLVPVPLNEVILAAGAFAKLGNMNLWAILSISLFGNVLTDMLGYFLAYRYGDDVLRILRIKKDANFFKVKGYLENYAYGTIYFTKIIGPFGPMVNLVSGLIRIPFKQFLLYDFLGNFTDVIFFVLAGYIAGDYWQDILRNIWIFGAVCIFVFVGYLIYKTRFRKIKPL